MTTQTQARAGVTDRRTTTFIAWLSLVALLLLLTLVARDAATRTSQPAPAVEVDIASRVVALVEEGVAIFPPHQVVGHVPTAVVEPQSHETPNGANGLLGMAAPDVRAALGAPDFVRRDGSSQMWRYGRGACTLTIFLHGRDKDLAVQHVEGRGLRSPSDPSADCAERLVGERRRADLPG